MPEPTAVLVALAHIHAWTHHDWTKTREMLAPDVHASVTSTDPSFRGGELTGVDTYMDRKTKAARLIEPGSVEVLSTIGDELNALVSVTFRIGLGPGGSMVTMARSCLYALDEDRKIKEERDAFFMLPTTPSRPTGDGPAPRVEATGAEWGNHSKMVARPSDRPRLQEFYRDVLGCYVGRGPQHPGGPEDTDLVRFANGFSAVVHYSDAALGEAELKMAIWLEVLTDDAAELEGRIMAFGVQPFDYFDKDHFYFQAPGGQVFRVAGK